MRRSWWCRMCWTALRALGAAARSRFGGGVVAVTGSVGKTGSKEMLRVALGAQGTVHAAEKSFNNHWGVPLTLARMPADRDFAVHRDRHECPWRDRAPWRVWRGRTWR